ncbi:MAG: GNAT family N-acetyltransferase [Acetatifactor sp.]|nr:GNAT family N-acetyltransferase [Acetatifactor sp.]
MLIRTATSEDADKLLNIYSYYVLNTAITFEYEVPSLEEFKGRIENTLKKYPYLVAEENGQILGYAYAGAFKGRAAYDWSVETSIYVSKDARRNHIGSALLDRLEETLKKQNILNVNACIGVPREEEDEYLTFDSVRFHEKKGYKAVGTFHECGYKFDRWYNMIWMEKMIGEHLSPQPPIVPFPELK